MVYIPEAVRAARPEAAKFRRYTGAPLDLRTGRPTDGSAATGCSDHGTVEQCRALGAVNPHAVMRPGGPCLVMDWPQHYF